MILLCWYTRLGHTGAERMSWLVKRGLLGPLALAALPTCEKYRASKLTGKLFEKAKYTLVLLDLFHSDICGPFNVKTRNESSYYITFIDDFTR